MGGDILRAQDLSRIDQRRALGKVLAGAAPVRARLDAGRDRDLGNVFDLLAGPGLAVLLHDDGIGPGGHHRPGEDARGGVLLKRLARRVPAAMRALMNNCVGASGFRSAWRTAYPSTAALS